MLIRLLFFEKLHFPQVDLRILFFLLFFLRVEGVHVRHFAASNQSNTIFKLWSVYVL